MHGQERCVICHQPVPPQPGGRRMTLCDSGACESALRLHLMRGLACCSACGRPIQLNRSSDRLLALCEAHQFQSHLGSTGRSSATFCSVCGIYLDGTPIRFESGTCGSKFCERVSAEQTAQEITRATALKRAQRSAEVEAFVRNLVRSDADSNRHVDLSIIVLPFIDRNFENPSTERLAKFSSHLLELAQLAHKDFQNSVHESQSEKIDNACFAESTNLDVDNDDVDFAPLNGAACGTCGGLCCKQGGNHAFLSVGKLKTMFEQGAVTSPSQIVDHYMSRIPDEVFSNSCIYHGRFGCALKREERANICNSYECVGLRTLHADFDGGHRSFHLASTNICDDSAAPKVYGLKVVSLD